MNSIPFSRKPRLASLAAATPTILCICVGCRDEAPLSDGGSSTTAVPTTDVGSGGGGDAGGSGGGGGAGGQSAGIEVIEGVGRVGRAVWGSGRLVWIGERQYNGTALPAALWALDNDGLPQPIIDYPGAVGPCAPLAVGADVAYLLYDFELVAVSLDSANIETLFELPPDQIKLRDLAVDPDDPDIIWGLGRNEPYNCNLFKFSAATKEFLPLAAVYFDYDCSGFGLTKSRAYVVDDIGLSILSRDTGELLDTRPGEGLGIVTDADWACWREADEIRCLSDTDEERTIEGKQGGNLHCEGLDTLALTPNYIAVGSVLPTRLEVVGFDGTSQTIDEHKAEQGGGGTFRSIRVGEQYLYWVSVRPSQPHDTIFRVPRP